MLKISLGIEECRSGALLAWWDGIGAVRVIRQAEGVVLMDRAEGGRSLAQLCSTGHDDSATAIIADMVAKLHRARAGPSPQCPPLSLWFDDLQTAAKRYGGIFSTAARQAHLLLAEPRDVGVLHGDIHHDNILDFGASGWLAIDPKGVIGDRCFDYANLFCNPECCDLSLGDQFERRVDLISNRADLRPTRLLWWILSWCGLSAAWLIEDGLPPTARLDLAHRAAAALHLP